VSFLGRLLAEQFNALTEVASVQREPTGLSVSTAKAQ